MPQEIVPGVYDVTVRLTDEGKRYRVFLIEDDVPTLFDVGLADTTDALFDELDELDVEPERVVITHCDGDHVGGFDAVVGRYDVETWVPEITEPGTEATPDHRYGDGDRIGSFTAVHAPGHEPENHALIDEDRGVAVLGDALSGADQRGLPEGYFHLPPAVYSQDLNQAEESLDRLLEYDFDVGLVYHGESVVENAHEKLDAYVNFPGKPDT